MYIEIVTMYATLRLECRVKRICCVSSKRIFGGNSFNSAFYLNVVYIVTISSLFSLHRKQCTNLLPSDVT